MTTLTSVRTPTAAQAAALDLAVQTAHLADQHKARDILVLDMRGLTSLYDYFVIATGVGKRQMHAIAEEIDAAMQGAGEARLGLEGYQACRWIVQDYGAVVVHLFDGVSRAYYALEELWADAPRIDWQRR
jgi:ribosome-associated protein